MMTVQEIMERHAKLLRDSSLLDGAGYNWNQEKALNDFCVKHFPALVTEIERQATEIERLTKLALRGQTREDKILRLEAEVERLREALLEEIGPETHHLRCASRNGPGPESFCDCYARRHAKARAALNEKEPMRTDPGERYATLDFDAGTVTPGKHKPEFRSVPNPRPEVGFDALDAEQGATGGVVPRDSLTDTAPRPRAALNEKEPDADA